MRIALFEVSESHDRESLERALAGHDLVFDPHPLMEETADAARGAEAVSVFIHSSVSAAVLERLPALRFVATRSTGFDHVDLEACAARGIAVSNVPHYGENTVAEHAFALILNLARKVHQAWLRTRAGDFSLDGLKGSDLNGKVLGVVGAGRIGLHVIRIARGFGMEVLAYDPAPQPLIAEVLGFRYAALDDLLAQADVVSLHLPLNERTHHLFDDDRFARMKRGVLLVNTARGGVVHTEALLRALDAGIVGGAGLDVVEGEELLAEEEQVLRTPATEAQLRQLLYNHMLMERPNVIVTPHLGWFSHEAGQRILDTTAENLRAFAAGAPINTVGR